MQVPLLQSTKSQILIGEVGLGEKVGIGDDEASGISQNMPVNPGKHSQVTKSLFSSMHSPLVQLMKSHSEILAVGVEETRTELEGVASVIGKLELSKTVLEGMKEEGGRKEEGNRINSELEIEKVKAGELKEGVGVRKGTRRLSELETTVANDEEMEIGSDLVGVGVKSEKLREGVGVRKGTRRLSELEMTKRNDEKVEIGSDLVGVRVMKDELGISISQNSPVNPTKHWQVKFSPKSSVTQVPLLQSIRSQILGCGRSVSQNCPVNPEKHSHLNISLGMSVKLSPEVSVTQVPLLQSIRSQIDGGGRVISQNSPVNPAKHWQVKFSPEVSVTQVPLLQSTKSQIDGGGRSISQNSPVNPAKHWHVKLSPKSSATHVPLLQSIMSQICIGGLGEGVVVINDDSIGTSQKSPVYPGKHWQVKFISNSSGTQVPLLQSIISQISGVVLGDGEGARMGISQNIPVHPGKHTQITVSLSNSVHSPLVQLMKSHKEISGVGEGDTKGVEVKREVEKARLELRSWTTDVEKGTIRLSELSIIKIKDEMVSLMLNRDEMSLIVLPEGVGISENDGIWEVIIELGVGLGVNMLIDSDNSDVDIGLRRPSELIVVVGNTGNAVDLGTNEDVKIGMKIELMSSGKELGVKILMESDNSEVGKGIRMFVILTGVLVGTTVVKISPISEVTVKSITGEVVKGSGLKISEEPIENRNVSVGVTSMEVSSDGEAIDDVRTSIVDAMLKDNLDVEGVGVITIITAVVSSIDIRSITLLLIL